MKLDLLHGQLVKHYQDIRSRKNKKSIQIESIVGQSYKKKIKEVEDASPVEDFLRNQQHIRVEAEPLYFRALRKRQLKVHFPGPPPPPAALEEIPYTYQIVPPVPFKIPKQKPGYVGDWVLEESHFTDKKSLSQYKNKSLMESYRNPEKKDSKNKFIVSDIDKKERFRSEVKKLVKQMREKNLSLKQIMKNRGVVKKSHNFYNSVDFFLMCRNGDKSVEELLQSNSQLVYDIDDQQMTGLHWAARQGHSQLCRLLTQKYKANCHAKDCYGRTPLHLAVQNKNVECIIRIFVEGGKLNAMNNDRKSVRGVATDAYIKYLLDRLQQTNYVIKTKGIKDQTQRIGELQTAIRNTLDESSLYF